MRIELWQKKLKGGYSFYGEVEVPDNFGHIYKEPIKQSVNIQISTEGTTPSQPTNVYREFFWQNSPLERALGSDKRRYLEV